MTAQLRDEYLVPSRAGDFASVQFGGLGAEQLDQECHADTECRLNFLQQWICELLRKNQQLRMSLEAAINQQTMEIDQ